MLTCHFQLEPDDQTLDKRLERLVGPEVFRNDDEGRLEKHFRFFKDYFKKLEIPIIIVGGTNGKGETSLYLEQLALGNGLDVFLWNSPHILSVRERFSFQGRPVQVDKLLRIFDRLESSALELSYYEFLFKCFCEFVCTGLEQAKAPVIILEVGLGGRLDATNFFDCDLSILTSVGRDHTAILGNSLEAILGEKIEITRSMKPLFSAVTQGFLKERIKAYCSQKKTPLFDIDLVIEQTSSFHQRNLILAQKTFSYFWSCVLFKENAAKLSIATSPWARPLRVTYKGCQFILLGSHNLDGLRHLARWAYSAQSDKQKAPLLFDEACFGFSRQIESELIQCLRIIGKSPCLGQMRRVFAFSHQRATPAQLLERAFSQLGDEELTGLALEQSFQDYFSNLKENQTILVSGSYYFLSHFLYSIPDLDNLSFD